MARVRVPQVARGGTLCAAATRAAPHGAFHPPGRPYSLVTLMALGPLGPASSSKETLVPSDRDR